MFINKPNSFITLFIVTILIQLLACSPRLMNYNRQVKRLENFEITRDEFDKKFYKLYSKDKKYSETDPYLRLKFKGCYIGSNHHGYRAYKFYPSGRVSEVNGMNFYPNNVSIFHASSSDSYFDINNKALRVEYLMSRDWNLYNIIKTGIITNDSIVFYQTKGWNSLSKANKIREVFIYNDSLTVDF